MAPFEKLGCGRGGTVMVPTLMNGSSDAAAARWGKLMAFGQIALSL